MGGKSFKFAFGREKQAELCEFEATLVYIVSSRQPGEKNHLHKLPMRQNYKLESQPVAWGMGKTKENC